MGFTCLVWCLVILVLMVFVQFICWFGDVGVWAFSGASRGAALPFRPGGLVAIWVCGLWVLDLGFC